MNEDVRWSLSAVADERTVLTTFLDFQRDALVRKCAELDDDDLRRRPIPSSNISLIGLVRHLSTVERWYFQAVIDGNFPGSLYDHESNAAFNDIDEETGQMAFSAWEVEVAVSRRIAGERSLDAIGTVPEAGTQLSLRWVLTHMIDEYARHLGHADLVREAIDGVTGE